MSNYILREWLSQANWYVDPVSGNDNNLGDTALVPVKTMAEIRRRWFETSSDPVLTSTETVITVMTGGCDELNLTDVRCPTGLRIVGVETTIATGTLNSQTPINRAANTFQQIGTAAFDFTQYLSKKIVLTSGAQSGAWAWISIIPGANSAETSAFVKQTDPYVAGTVVSPGGAETFKIVSLPTFAGVVNEGGAPYDNIVVVIEKLSISSQPLGSMGCGFMVTNGCDYSAGLNRAIGGVFVNSTGCQYGFWTWSETCFCDIYAGHMIGSVVGGGGGGASVIRFRSDTMFRDAKINTNSNKVVLQACGFHQTTAAKACISIDPRGQCDLVAGGAVYGVTNNGDAFDLGAFATVVGSGVTPTISTGNGKNVQFGSASKTFAQVPFMDFTVGAAGSANGSAWV